MPVAADSQAAESRASPQMAAHDPQATGKIAWSELNVLVIDDSSGMRSMIRDILHELGITHIFEAGTGREALQFTDAPAAMADIVLCDWNMPGMSGIELLQQMRGASSDRAFMMVTSRNDMESVREAIMAGVNGYIVKPFSASDLKRKFAAVLSARKAC